MCTTFEIVQRVRDSLKVGLSGIAKRYGFQTVHNFYKVYATAKIVYAEYRDKADRWEELYGEMHQDKQKKAYTGVYRIVKEQMPKDKRNRLQKQGQRGKIVSSLSFYLFILEK